MGRSFASGVAAALAVLAALPGFTPAASADPAAPMHEISPPTDAESPAAQLVLTGILITPGLREALFVPPGDTKAGGTVRLHEGDAVDGGTITRIETDAVILTSNGTKRRLTPEHGGAGEDHPGEGKTTVAIPRAPAIIRSADPRVPGIASHLPPVLEY